MAKKSTLIALLCATITALSTQTAFAIHLSPQQAIERLQKTSAENTLPIDKIEPIPAYIAKSEQTDIPAYYVFNNSTQAGGYTILSASQQTEPVLGYTTSGTFDYETLPPAMKWWLSEYQKQIEYAESMPTTDIRLYPAAVPDHRKAIQPLIKSKWNQSAPYNQDCPVLHGKQAPTGCVATAMAQIMRYYQWPQHGYGSNSYDFEYTYTEDKQEFTDTDSQQMDFSEVYFDWTQMTLTYTSESTQPQKDAVATLMHACGVSVDMGYGQNASGAQSRKLPPAYINYFNYDKSAFYHERKYFTTAEWEDLIYNEIASGRPVQYSGSNEKSGHSFVCDGYQADGFYHINWGWGGTSDGYFKLSALNPESQGIGGSKSGYNAGQGAVVNIKLPEESSTYTYSVVSSAGLSAPEQTVGRNATILIFPNSEAQKVSGTVFYNNSPVVIPTVYYGVKIKKRETSETSYHASFYSNDLPVNRGYASISFSASIIKSAGIYEISPAFSLDKGITWHDIRIPKTEPQYIILDVTDSDVTVITPTTAANLSATISDLPSEMVQNGIYNINASVSNTGEYFYNDIYCAFLKLGSDGSSAVIEKIAGAAMTELETGATANINLSVNTSELNVGSDYYFALLSKSSPGQYTVISQIHSVAITQQGSLNVTFAIANQINGKVPMNNIRITGKAEAINGDFNNKIQFYIFENFDDDGDGYVNCVDIADTGILNITSGNTVSLNAKGVITDGRVGAQYFIKARANDEYIGKTILFILDDEESGIATVIDTSAGKLQVTPNPVSNVAQVSAPSPIESIAIYSLQGALIFNQKFNNNENIVNINISDLANGHYLLQAITRQGTTATHIIKK